MFPLRIEGTGFVTAAGTPFHWKGITAFELAKHIADGREREAVAYLDWVRSEQLTVVRVLLMARQLFELTPEDGRAALPRLLDLATERGIAVEVVALVDTKGLALDHEAHIREVGRIALEKANAFVEIANEPGHPTQDPRLHDPAYATRLAAIVPEPVIVALGSLEYGEDFAAGDYVTLHSHRGAREWEHVLGLSAGARRVAALKKPVVSDEPIGAGPEYQPGRRDNQPARFAAAAALTRLAGMGATFHYESGLRARIPRAREAACFAAWQTGLALVSDLAPGGEFLEGERVAEVGRVEGAQRAFARVSGGQATVLLIDPRPSASVTWMPGWTETRRAGVPGVLLASARR